MKHDTKQIRLLSEYCSREAREAERGRRDARQDITRIQVRRAARAASPAGLAALFPGLKLAKGSKP